MSSYTHLPMEPTISPTSTGGLGGMGALFSSLSEGVSITSGLKKVNADMKTKNRTIVENSSALLLLKSKDGEGATKFGWSTQSMLIYLLLQLYYLIFIRLFQSPTEDYRTHFLFCNYNITNFLFAGGAEDAGSNDGEGESFSYNWSTSSCMSIRFPTTYLFICPANCRFRSTKYAFVKFKLN